MDKGDLPPGLGNNKDSHQSNFTMANDDMPPGLGSSNNNNNNSHQSNYSNSHQSNFTMANDDMPPGFLDNSVVSPQSFGVGVAATTSMTTSSSSSSSATPSHSAAAMQYLVPPMEEEPDIVVGHDEKSLSEYCPGDAADQFFDDQEQGGSPMQQQHQQQTFTKHDYDDDDVEVTSIINNSNSNSNVTVMGEPIFTPAGEPSEGGGKLLSKKDIKCLRNFLIILAAVVIVAVVLVTQREALGIVGGGGGSETSSSPAGEDDGPTTTTPTTSAPSSRTPSAPSSPTALSSTSPTDSSAQVKESSFPPTASPTRALTMTATPTAAPTTAQPTASPSEIPSGTPSLFPTFTCPLVTDSCSAQCTDRRGPDLDRHGRTGFCPAGSLICAGGSRAWIFARGRQVTHQRVNARLFRDVIPCTVVGTNDTLAIEVEEVAKGSGYTFRIMGGGDSENNYAITAVNLAAANAQGNNAPAEAAHFCDFTTSDSCASPTLSTEPLYTPPDTILGNGTLIPLDHVDLCVADCFSTSTPTASPSSNDMITQTSAPSSGVSAVPSASPTDSSSVQVKESSFDPTASPTMPPTTASPTTAPPTLEPTTAQPTLAPTTASPSQFPSSTPSLFPTFTCPIVTDSCTAQCTDRRDENMDRHGRADFCPAGSLICAGENRAVRFARGRQVTFQRANAGMFRGVIPCTVAGTNDTLAIEVEEVAKASGYKFRVMDSDTENNYAITAVNLAATNSQGNNAPVEATHFCDFTTGDSCASPTRSTESLYTPKDNDLGDGTLIPLNHIDLCVADCFSTVEPTVSPSSIFPSSGPSRGPDF
mmetsp:Transcript_29530/g.68902  ORF Transcript_29530/g.68902 Transcript_29530/m.68902 type:complete len:815 (+) Transcript_29530:106-2550(+)